MHHLTAEQQKKEGAHYTPSSLATFVARQICKIAPLNNAKGCIKILDPAVGDGELICALLREIHLRRNITIEAIAFDTDITALHKSENRILLCNYADTTIEYRGENFLDYSLSAGCDRRLGPLFYNNDIHGKFDLVIANPPYVRTQILGQKQAHAIALEFGLKGRVDLYHAFLIGIAEVLKPGGIAGIIVSNRFLTTQAGASVRSELLNRYEILHVWDLGDTKLFEAAVLPAVLLLRKLPCSVASDYNTKFTSIYSCTSNKIEPKHISNIFDKIEKTGTFILPDSRMFNISQGRLHTGNAPGDVWRLSDPTTDAWLRCVEEHTSLRFKDLGKIRVGVKTTADKVFIRTDWRTLPENEQPELLRPLITHHIARRFRALEIEPRKEILYTHYKHNGCKKPVDLSSYPRAASYLYKHRDILEARTYVREAGRKWFEIWVPQDPSVWSQPKLVFRDISKEPTFWMNLSGAVVNGDCYWMTAADPKSEKLLWLALGVANSSFIEMYYDTCFNNKLYAGRRRYMTQYVEMFPLPDPSSCIAKQIEECTRAIYDGLDKRDVSALELELNELVSLAFGLT